MNYYESKFNRYVSNIKQTWTTRNELLNKCNNKKEFPSYFIINGDKIDNKEDIVNNFNSFFQNIGPTLSANIPQHKHITIKTFLKEKIAFSFEFSLLEQETVFKIISKINSKHSCGHDDISTMLMKNICPLILSPITLIFNQSLSTGIFPDRLKIAKIIPLFKKEDPHKLDNYRPISLLPAFSKIFEKAVFIQLYEYFNKNNLLYKSQYGFRTLHSTELASLEIIDIIGKDLDNGKLPIGVFLDLSKAFDTLDHTILLLNHCLGLGHETMVCAVCLTMFLWICDMTRLLRGTFHVLVVFAPNLVLCHLACSITILLGTLLMSDT